MKPKPLSKEGIPRALEKADRYRLLNEPMEAESICLDVLATEPDHQEALVTLVLALADQVGQVEGCEQQCQTLLPKIKDPYKNAYYSGVVFERRAKAILRKDLPAQLAYDWFHEALACYEKAERLAPRGNQDAILRWNTCVRIMSKYPELQRAARYAEPWAE